MFPILQSQKSRNYLFQNTSVVSSNHEDKYCEFTYCTQDKTANLSLEIKYQLKSQHRFSGACLGDLSNEAVTFAAPPLASVRWFQGVQSSEVTGLAGGNSAE